MRLAITIFLALLIGQTVQAQPALVCNADTAAILRYEEQFYHGDPLFSGTGNNTDSSFYLATLMLRQATAAGYKRGIAKGHNCLGLAYGFHKHDPLTALLHFSIAKQLFAELADTRGLGGALANIGIQYLANAHYKAAGDTLSMAIEILEKTGDSLYLAATLHALAEVDLHNKNYPAAEQRLRAAMALAMLCSHKRLLMHVQLALGWAMAGQKKYNDAETYARASLLSAIELNDDALVAASKKCLRHATHHHN